MNDHGRTQREAGICTPRREASEERKPADTLILDFRPPEKVNFCCLRHTVCGTLLQQTNTLGSARKFSFNRNTHFCPLGHDLMVCKMKPHAGLCTDNTGSCLGFSLSLSLSLPLPCQFPLSLFLKINKLKKIYFCPNSAPDSLLQQIPISSQKRCLRPVI